MKQGLLARVLEGRQSLENPRTGFSVWLDNVFGGSETTAGTRIDERRAMNLSAVYAAVRYLTNAVMILRPIVYERMARGRDRAPTHPLYQVLHGAPNPMMHGPQYFELAQAHLELWGNHYAEIVRDGAGQVRELWPLLPGHTEVQIRNDRKVFTTTIDGEQTTLSAERVFHVAGFGFDGVRGQSIISCARDSMGLTQAAEEYGARWFGDGATPPAVLTYPDQLNEEQFQNLRKSWEDRQGGLTNRQRIAILEEGMKYEAIGLPPGDSQFIETRRLQTEEVARWFGVPPHKINDLSRATFSNIEHQDLEASKQALMPRTTRWEAAIQQQLFTDRDRERYFVEFLFANLLRADSKARAEFYRSMFQVAGMSANDIREKENMNPIPGGDEYFVPLNMIPVTAAQQATVDSGTDEPDTTPEPEDDAAPSEFEQRADARVRIERQVLSRRRLRAAHEPVLADIAGRLTRAEAQALRRTLKQGKVDLPRWAYTVYTDDYAEKVRARFGPALRAYLGAMVQATEDVLGAPLEDRTQVERFFAGYLHRFGVRWVASHRGQLLVAAALGPEAVMGLADRWEGDHAGQFARNEAVKAGEAFTRAAFIAGAVAGFVWVASGDTCPFCRRMDGAIVNRSEPFARNGDTMNIDGAEPLTMRSNIAHPPLHRGCDCVIVPTL